MVDHFSTYIFQKRGVYYFSRRIPSDLTNNYQKPRIVFSLKTRSTQTATARAMVFATKLDDDWRSMRWRNTDNPLSRFLRQQVKESPGKSGSPRTPTISEARATYLKHKSVGRPKTFTQAVDRAVNNFVSFLGDREVGDISRLEINQFRDHLVANGLSIPSVKRYFTTLKAVFNFASRELDFEEPRVFSNIYYGEDSGPTHKRSSFKLKELHKLQADCRNKDDELRWLIALLSDTGMRLSEALGLTKGDIVLTTPHPYIKLKPHPWRRLKTTSSVRTIPLEGHARWAIKRAMDATNGEFLFPAYCDVDSCRANSASGALNKWISPRISNGAVIHSLRHSFRDRLRAVECPKDIIDRIGGWSVGGVGESYGEGHPISVLSKWVLKAVGDQK